MINRMQAIKLKILSLIISFIRKDIAVNITAM